ncbi:MAG: LacI family DNA-binding transcriptional regulator [Opitutales bacterium]
MHTRVTLSAVATAAGVSAATASRALSNHPRISADTRKRVRRAAADLGYRPDPALSALARTRWRGDSRHDGVLLALVLWTERHRSSFPQCEAFIEQAEALGYGTAVLEKRTYASDETLQRVLGARAAAGVALVVDYHVQRPPELDWSSVAVLQMGLDPVERPLFDACAVDHFSEHLRAMRETLAGGFQRPAVVLYEPRFLPYEHRRLGALESAWREAGGSRRLPLLWLNPVAAGAHGKLRAWIEKCRPDVLLAQTSWPRHALDNLRMAAPQRPAVVDLSAYRNLPEQGRASARLLAGKVQHRDYGRPAHPVLSLV